MTTLKPLIILQSHHIQYPRKVPKTRPKNRRKDDTELLSPPVVNGWVVMHNSVDYDFDLIGLINLGVMRVLVGVKVCGRL